MERLSIDRDTEGADLKFIRTGIALAGIAIGACVPVSAAGPEADSDLTMMLSGYRHARLCMQRGHAFTKQDVDQLDRLIKKRVKALRQEVVLATRDLVATYPMGNSRRECESIKFVLPAMLPAFKR